MTTATTNADKGALQIPSSLKAYTVPGAEYVASSGLKDIDGICVGALVFATASSDSILHRHEDYVLLVKRTADGGRMDGLWETPGGGCDPDDPSIIHCCTRELREESGLNATGIIDMLGSYSFPTRSHMRVLKFNFLIGGIREAPNRPLKLADIPVKLDPSEHTDFVWATERQVKEDEFPITSQEQKDVTLIGFKRRKEGGYARKSDLYSAGIMQ